MTFLKAARSGTALRSTSSALLAAAILGVGFGAGSAQAQVSFAGNYSQNFDTLPNSGTGNFTDNSTITGFYAFRDGGTPFPLLVGNGSSNAGGLYSFGTTGSSERALGSIGSGATGTLSYGVQLLNTSGGVINSLTVNYSGEQWRNGGNTTAQNLEFSYFNAGTSNANFITGTSYTDFNALDYTSTVNTATAAALDGNANSTAKSSTITGLNWQAGQYVWLRWQDENSAGNDHGQAIDNLVLSAVVTPPVGGGVAPEPGSLAFLLPVLPAIGLMARRRKK